MMWSELSIPAGCLFVFREERVGPPAPTFSVAYSSAITGQILFKFNICMQLPWEKFLNTLWCHDISTREVT